MDDISKILDSNEKIDILPHSNYKIIQDSKKFCFGIDAVLLADYVVRLESRKKNTQKIVDLGTGNGIIPLLLNYKISNSFISGIEIQKECALMAQRSVELNNLNQKISIINGDIKNIQNLMERNTTDIVVSNPPYMINSHGKQNPSDYKKIARHEILCNLEDVIKAASYLLGSKKSFYMIHKPFRLNQIFSLLQQYKLEPKNIRFVFPYVDKEPTMVLIQAIKGANARLTVESPLIVYEGVKQYSKEVLEIYGKK